MKKQRMSKRKSNQDEIKTTSIKNILPHVTFDNKFLILLIALIAVIFRLVYFFHLKLSSPVYSLYIHDSALFNQLAQDVANNGIIGKHAFYISPLYVYFLALIYKIFGDSFNIVRLLQFILGVGTALFTYSLGTRFFNKKTGAIAGISAAVYAPFIFFEGNLLGTSLVTFLLAGSIFCLIVPKKEYVVYLTAFLSGLLLSLAVTGRPNLIFLMPVPLVYFYVTKNDYNLKSYILPLIALTGLSLPIALTSVHNYMAEKTPIPLTTHGGINFYIGNHEIATGVWKAPEGINPDVSAINLEESKRYAEKETGKELSPSQVSQFWYNKSFQYILHHPFSWSGLVMKKFILFWSSYETPLNFDYAFHQRFSFLLRFPLFNLIIFMPLALFALFFYCREWRTYWILYAILGLGCLSIMVFFMADRYRLPLVPFIIIMSAAGLVKLYELVKTPGKSRWLWGSVVFILFTVQIGYTYTTIKNSNFANDFYNLSLAHLLEENPKAAVYWGQRAIAEDPDLQHAHYNLGVSYLKLKEHENAFKEFSIAASLDPTDAGAQRNLGALLLMQQKYRQALRFLENAVRLDPYNINGLMNLGLAYYYQNNFDKAIASWEKVIKIDPTIEQAEINIKAALEAMRTKS